MNLRKTISIGFLMVFTLIISHKGYSQGTQNMPKDSFIQHYTITRQILADQNQSPWFQKGYDAYKPDASIVNAMKKFKKHVSFTVIGGRWCSDTQNLLPQFLKFSDEAGYTGNKVKLIGVDEHKKDIEGNTPDKVQNVPTVIIYYDGKEVGRVVESVQQSIEADIYGQIMSYLEWIGALPN